MPELNGRLTAEDQEKVTRWLNDHWDAPRLCPISGDQSWTITSRLVYLSGFLPTDILTSPKVDIYPSVMVVCNGCGYTLLFSASAMGIKQPTPETENG